MSVDGPNGVGKSTLIKAIRQNLTQQGHRVYLTKEVSNSSLGKFIRHKHRDYSGKTLAFLLAADRQNHLDRDILPALQKYDIVITDRYVDSSLVFQRLDGVPMPFVWKLNEDFLKPNLSVVVLAAAGIIVSRMARRTSLDRFEQEFGRIDEIRLFKAAALFMEKNGFNVLRYDNGKNSVEIGAKILADKIVCLAKKGRKPK